MNTTSLICLFLFWKAQKKLTEHQRTGAHDTLDEDPLKYTSIKTLCFVPSVLGVLKLLAQLTGKDEGLRRWWAKLATSHPFYWFLKRMYLANLTLYFGLGAACLGLDILEWPQFLYKHKIQPDAVVDYETQLPKLLYTLLLNIGSPALLALIPGTDNIKEAVATKLAGFVRLSPELPSVVEVTKHYWTFLLTYDILFFYSHWALHTKYLYSTIHKQHHEWKSPTALAAAYAHPIEHILSNVAPAALATLYLRPHILTFTLYAALGLIITLSDHSGYEFIDTSAAHNIHHRTFTSNYGVSGFFDKLHETRVLSKHPSKSEHSNREL